jgi:Rab-GTPase-TBC domain
VIVNVLFEKYAQISLLTVSVYDLVLLYCVTGDDELHAAPLPPFVNKTCQERKHLTDAGVCAVKRILSVVSHERPDITYSPALFTLTCVLLHYLDEATTYACVSTLLRSKQRYIAQTSIAYKARALVLRELSRKYAVSSMFYGTLSGSSCLQFFTCCPPEWQLL